MVKIRGVDALVFGYGKNLQYFSGAKPVSPSVSLFIIRGKKTILTSNLEKANVPRDAKVIVYEKKTEIEKYFKKILRGCRRIGLDGGTNFSFYLKLKKWLPKRKFVDVSEQLYQIRSIKSSGEIAKIQTAIRIAEAGMRAVLSKIKPGLSEERIEQMLKMEFLKHLAEVNFCIVQADSNSADIHKRVSKKKLKNVLLLDIGPIYQGYASDISRTFFFGKKTELHKEVYAAVLGAQRTALKKIAPGVKASEVYLAAKTALGKYAKYFTHGLGHGIGLDYHEAPSLSEESKDVLRPGMVFTVEPGVYLPGKFGVRIEDVVLVTKKGYKLLSHFKK